jgi:hypothetical protein
MSGGNITDLRHPRNTQPNLGQVNSHKENLYSLYIFLSVEGSVFFFLYSGWKFAKFQP